MDESRFRCTLVAPDGMSRRVGPRGLLIGRDPSSDIMIADPSVSRRHALLRASEEGVELLSLGRVAIEYNGRPCERSQLLADGDVIKVHDMTFVVRVELPEPSSAATTYRLVSGRSSYGLSHTPFVVGGAESDDLIIDGWPGSVLRFHLAQGGVFVEVSDGRATNNGVAIDANALEELAVGDVIGYLDTRFEIARAVVSSQTTITNKPDELPTRVAIELLPRGGRVVFTMPSGELTVYLADRRLDLITALVRPPEGYAPGDFIPDDVLRAIVWPRNPDVSRSEINVHVTRCRKDLLAAGLAGPRLLQRSPTGGATRLALAPGCTIELA